jgi:hypothetical protein
MVDAPILVARCVAAQTLVNVTCAELWFLLSTVTFGAEGVVVEQAGAAEHPQEATVTSVRRQVRSGRRLSTANVLLVRPQGK